MAGVATVNPTGNDDIDGLIAGTRWTGRITFSFLDGGGSGTTYFEHPQRFTVAGLLVGEYSESPVQGLPVIKSTYGSVESLVSAPISYREPTLDGLGQRHYAPGVLKFRDVRTLDLYETSAPGESGGSSFIKMSSNNSVSGTREFFSSAEFSNFIYMKAIGEALGLKSATEAGGVANVAVPANHDSFEYSVMSQRAYIGSPVFASRSSYYGISTSALPQTFMPLDIQALQRLYGADYSTNAGDTVYQWSPVTGQIIVNGDNSFTAPPTNRIFMTVWDGGGTDTYDLSNYSGAMSIDLAPGASSLFSQAQRGLIMGGQVRSDDVYYVHGNVYNALSYNDNPVSLIENAISGLGNDTLRGNAADNMLNGGGGADAMAGLAGNDSYVVDNPGDVVFEIPGEGIDTLWTSVNRGLDNDFEAIVLFGAATDAGGNGQDNIVSGNERDNNLYGIGGVDSLYGHDGSDRLFGEDDNDYMTGGEGTDAYYGGAGYDYAILEEGGGVDYFVDWNAAQDRVVFDSDIFSSIDAALSAAFQNGTDVVIWDGQDGIVLQNAKVADLTASNFLFV